MEEEGTTGLFSLFCLIGIEEMEKDISLIRVCILDHLANTGACSPAQL
jgi:hypothetical protein